MSASPQWPPERESTVCAEFFPPNNWSQAAPLGWGHCIMRSFIKMITHHSSYKCNGSLVSRSCWLFSLPHSFQPLSTTSSAGLLQADQHAQQMLLHQADQHARYGQSRFFPSHYLGCNVLGEFECKNSTLISEVCQLVVLSLFFFHHDMPGRKCPHVCHFLISDSCLLPTA